MITRRDFMTQSGLGAMSILTSRGSLAANSGQGNAPIRKHLATDPHRPQYHFLPKANWMNDPNGPIFWKGYYHLFYQHNPGAAIWGDMHWGHGRSKDMVHWEHLPMALAPTPGGPDKEGCFSGSAFINDGAPTLVYTGVSPEVQCLATSDDRMITWKKWRTNPVMSSPPTGLQVTGFRDPSIWREADSWLMTVGSGFKGQGGAVLIYSSKDLTHWDYLHPLLAGPPFENHDAGRSDPYDAVAAGDMWECPDFFPLGQKHGLLVSTQGRVYYMTGHYSGRKFERETSGFVDGSDLYYAAKSFQDSQGRRILWGWIREARNEPAERRAGWAGVMSLPRVLSLDTDGMLRMEPLPELAMLRGRHHRMVATELSSFVPVVEVKGDSLEIHLEADAGGAKEVGITFRRSPDGAEETTLAYDAASGNVVLDARHSSLSPEANRDVYKAPLKLRTGELLRLTVFVNGSVVEVFANGRACLTGRLIPRGGTAWESESSPRMAVPK